MSVLVVCAIVLFACMCVQPHNLDVIPHNLQHNLDMYYTEILMDIDAVTIAVWLAALTRVLITHTHTH